MSTVDLHPASQPERAVAPEPAPPEPPSLRQRATSGSLWTVLGFGGGQALRFAANLALTRLLFPEAFGTMALINALVIGLHLFSDVGIIPSIIQNKRGDDPRFLNTAWTIQVIRGAVLWLVACLIAYPMAWLYADPALSLFIPIAATTAVIDGLCSTKLYLLHRHLTLRKLTLIELGSQGLSSAIMIGWALLWPSLWALVGGTIAYSMIHTALSHRLQGARNKLQWDRECAGQLFGFGKWVFLSTLLTFFADQSHLLIFGTLVSRELLGVYNIAFMIALMPTQAITRVGSTVFFPSFSRLLETNADFSVGFGAARTVLSVAGGYCVAGMIAAGQPTIEILYDERYADGGWILQLLAISAWFQILECSSGAALLALGKVRPLAAGNGAKVASIAVLIPLGYYLGGFAGAVTGFSLSVVSKYAISTTVAMRHGLPVLRCDLLLSAWVAATGGGAFAAVLFLRSQGAGPIAQLATAIAAVTVGWVFPGFRVWRRWRNHGQA